MLAKYIDAEQAIRWIEHDALSQVYYSKSDAIDCINALPTADVVPRTEVERLQEQIEQLKLDLYYSVCREDEVVAKPQMKFLSRFMRIASTNTVISTMRHLAN